jgi:hypothetical protein
MKATLTSFEAVIGWIGSPSRIPWTVSFLKNESRSFTSNPT